MARMSDQIEGVARQGVGRIQDAVGGLTGDAKTQIKGKLNEAAGSVQSAYGQAKDQARGAVNHAKGRAEDTLDDIEQYLRDRPFTAIGIGVGLGLLLAHMLGGGRKTIYLRERARP
jgi:uncharacterized protein YjbJ (UPF0337 family)